MKIIAVIPARYASTRFPAKLMQDLGGQTVIMQTYFATVATGLFDDVFVVTDSEIIFEEVTKHQGKVLMSTKDHQSGSDRIAEAIESMDVDVVINVQGDEPFVSKSNLAKLITIFKEDSHKNVDVASLMTQINSQQEIQNPNNVKVVVDNASMALYFSRSVIPFVRDSDLNVVYYQHIGIYAFRKQALLDFATLEVSTLESIEKLEQLRYLENGKRIKMAITTELGVGIDTIEDLEKARKLWEALQSKATS